MLRITIFHPGVGHVRVFEPVSWHVFVWMMFLICCDPSMPVCPQVKNFFDALWEEPSAAAQWGNRWNQSDLHIKSLYKLIHRPLFDELPDHIMWNPDIFFGYECVTLKPCTIGYFWNTLCSYECYLLNCSLLFMSLELSLWVSTFLQLL